MARAPCGVGEPEIWLVFLFFLFISFTYAACNDVNARAHAHARVFLKKHKKGRPHIRSLPFNDENEMGDIFNFTAKNEKTG